MSILNNMEMFAFEKSGWCLIEESLDGNTIYFGKPTIDDATETSKAWYIKKVTIETAADGRKITKTRRAVGKCNAWVDKETLKYVY